MNSDECGCQAFRDRLPGMRGHVGARDRLSGKKPTTGATPYREALRGGEHMRLDSELFQRASEALKAEPPPAVATRKAADDRAKEWLGALR